MKIAYVYDAVYPWVKGGAEKRIYELSRRLAKRGHDVHCYGMKWWQGEDEILGEKGRGAQVIEWAVARLTDHNIAVSLRTQRDLLRLGAIEYKNY
jgi:hypothetical protein